MPSTLREKLLVQLGLDAREFQRDMKRATKDIGDIKKASDNLGRAFTNLKRLAIAGFAGWGIKELSQSFLDAGQSIQRMNLGLRSALGTIKQATDTTQWLRKESERLGLVFESQVKSFQKIAAAAKGTALEGQKIRDVYLAVAEASTALQLSAGETEGALYALGQMISKGTVQAEELRGQLGERLPGAFQIAARSMGITTQALNKMLEQGQVIAADFLPKFGRQLREEFGKAAVESANSLTANINRLNNAWFELRATVMESGVTKAITDALIDINKGLREWLENNDALIKQAVPKYLNEIKEKLTSIYKFYQDLPEDLVGSAGVGIIGRLLFGSWKIGTIIAAVDYLSKKVKGMLSKEELEAAKIIQQGGTADEIMNALGYGVQTRQMPTDYIGINTPRANFGAAATASTANQKVQINQAANEKMIQLHNQRLEAERELEIKFNEEMARRRLEKTEETTKEIENTFKHMLENIHDATSNVFYDIMSGTINSWDDMLDTMKGYFFRFIAEVAAEKIILSVVAPIATQMLGAGTANAGSILATTSGGSSLAGTAISLGSKVPGYLSNIPGLGFLNAPLSSIGIGGAGIGGLSGALTTGAETVGLSGALGGMSIGAALGWAGAGVAFGLMVYNMFSGKKTTYGDTSIGGVTMGTGGFPGLQLTDPFTMLSGGKRTFATGLADTLNDTTEVLLDSYNEQIYDVLNLMGRDAIDQFEIFLKGGPYRRQTPDLGFEIWSKTEDYEGDVEKIIKNITDNIDIGLSQWAQSQGFKDWEDMKSWGVVMYGQRQLAAKINPAMATQFFMSDVAFRYNVKQEDLLKVDWDAFVNALADPANSKAINDYINSIEGLDWTTLANDAWALKEIFDQLDISINDNLESLRNQANARAYMAGGGNMQDYYWGLGYSMYGQMMAGGDYTVTDLQNFSAIVGQWYQAAVDSAFQIAENMERAADAAEKTLMNIRFGSLSPLLPSAKFKEAEKYIHDLYMAAKGGDWEAAQQMIQFAPQFLQIAQDANKSSMAYQETFQHVVTGLEEFAALKGTGQVDLTIINTTLTNILYAIDAMKPTALGNTAGGAAGTGLPSQLSALEGKYAAYGIKIDETFAKNIVSWMNSVTSQEFARFAGDLGVTVQELMADIQLIRNYFGFQHGGIAMGPTSGYMAMLHGTEKIEPQRGRGFGLEEDILTELKSLNQKITMMMAGQQGGGKAIMVLNGKEIEMEFKKIADMVSVERDNNPSLRGRPRYY